MDMAPRDSKMKALYLLVKNNMAHTCSLPPSLESPLIHSPSVLQIRLVLCELLEVTE